jgi:hypothetical protein
MAKRCLTCGMPLDGSRKQTKTPSLEPIDLTKYRFLSRNFNLPSSIPEI